MLEKYFEDLEKRIDEQEEERLYRDWVGFLEGKFKGEIFDPKRKAVRLPEIEWPEIPVNDTLDDPDKMLLSQFRNCSQILAEGSGYLMCLRANYGTSIMPSLFGAELYIMDREVNTLPTSYPLEGGAERMKALAEEGAPDIHQALGEKVLAMGERFMEIKSKYPKIGKYVHVYHPDWQGPMDACEVLWGSGIFLDIVDKPATVKALLNVITETYTKFAKEWTRIAPFEENYNAHWGNLMKGNIMLRDDSAMNLSPEMFEEFIRPYDQRLLKEYGGGSIHFCGRGDHYIESISEMDGVHAIQMSQPEYNDMEIIYQNTVDKGISLLGFPNNTARKTLDEGRSLHGRVHSSTCARPRY